MTGRSLSEALESSMADVLEKMFFIRTLGVPGETAPQIDFVAGLTFEGDPPGSFTLRISKAAACSIAADFLGAEECELSEREVSDVVCELANMICGSVLSRVESNSTFRLAAPRLIEQPQPAPDPGEVPPGGATHVVEISGGLLVASIQTETPGCCKVEEYAY
jgi:CheY-specific phosphatase CheX